MGMYRRATIRWWQMGGTESWQLAKPAVKVPKVILAIEYKKALEVQEKWLPSPPLEPESVKTETRVVQLPDLLVYFWVWNLDDHVPQSASLDEKNALALGLWLLY
ncbi:hypothetical protein POM88_007297 [Heracleum sosnowskyi]|uniref:Uncharacterized protein n=1 Tax=Heracleum sosnowskyi TaxID=360622 RepID=A0AAD8J4E9_9APIA|nr:hypothetical protein POM88_007297 [Heracleum sosnowskyi]